MYGFELKVIFVKYELHDTVEKGFGRFQTKTWLQTLTQQNIISKAEVYEIFDLF